MDILGQIKKIARSSKYQVLYSQSKEMTGLRIFKNEYDFTFLQLFFLNWLSTYSTLYQDLAMGEEYISEEVIRDNLRTEAYLLYKKKKREKENKKNSYEQNKEEKKNKGKPSMPGVKFY